MVVHVKGAVMLPRTELPGVIVLRLLCASADCPVRMPISGIVSCGWAAAATVTRVRQIRRGQSLKDSRLVAQVVDEITGFGRFEKTAKSAVTADATEGLSLPHGPYRRELFLAPRLGIPAPGEYPW